MSDTTLRVHEVGGGLYRVELWGPSGLIKRRRDVSPGRLEAVKALMLASVAGHDRRDGEEPPVAALRPVSPSPPGTAGLGDLFVRRNELERTLAGVEHDIDRELARLYFAERMPSTQLAALASRLSGRSMSRQRLHKRLSRTR